MTVLVTGASGYVGSRLVPRLLADGHRVRVLVRDEARVRTRPWVEDVEVVVGDVRDARAVTSALGACDTAVYLVHAMEVAGADFVAAEVRGARTFADAASLVGVGHVVYLGALADETDPRLSAHLASRVDTGRRLADGGPPTTELRASLVLGAGSAPFELVRFSARSSPVVARPSWTRHRCQPIAIADLLEVLATTVSDRPSRQHRVVEVAGPETCEYGELIHRLRAVEGRVALPTLDVPGVLPEVAALAATVTTPIPAGLVAPLVASLAHDTVVTGRHETWLGAIGIDTAMRAALDGVGAGATMAGDPSWVGRPGDLASMVGWWATRVPAGIRQGPQLATLATRMARSALGGQR